MVKLKNLIIEEKTDNDVLRKEYKKWAKDVRKAMKKVASNKYYKMMDLINMDFDETPEWTKISKEVRGIWKHHFEIEKILDRLDNKIEKLEK
jgi:hypothetical protein